MVLIVDGGVRNQWKRGLERVVSGADGRTLLVMGVSERTNGSPTGKERVVFIMVCVKT